MNDTETSRILNRAEEAVASGNSLKATGFWRVVGRVRGSRDLANAHAVQIGRIDRGAFEAGVRLRIPSWLGTSLLAAGTFSGVALVVFSSTPGRPLYRALVFLSGFGLILVSSHSLSHWLVGRCLGIRFTHYFIGGPPPPRPGAKTDYATYLLTSPRRRAVMHASGAVVTKLLPFILMPAAADLDVGIWLVAFLAVVGVVQIITDLVFSTKSSDWKKVIRELKAASDW